jgi:hypothetical protein
MMLREDESKHLMVLGGDLELVMPVWQQQPISLANALLLAIFNFTNEPVILGCMLNLLERDGQPPGRLRTNLIWYQSRRPEAGSSFSTISSMCPGKQWLFVRTHVTLKSERIVYAPAFHERHSA